MMRIELPADMPCYRCPFNYDGSTCKASLTEGEVWSDDAGAFVPAAFGIDAQEGRCTDDNSDKTDNDPYRTRPDWCPIDNGEVLVSIRRAR